MTLVTLLFIGAICFGADADDASGAVTAVAVAAFAAVADAVTQMTVDWFNDHF